MSEVQRIIVPAQDPVTEEMIKKHFPVLPDLKNDGSVTCPECGGELVFLINKKYKKCEYCPDCGQHIEWY